MFGGNWGPSGTVGDTCDHGDCSAAPMVRAMFDNGELRLCLHHWNAASDAITSCATFRRVAARQIVLDAPKVLARDAD